MRRGCSTQNENLHKSSVSKVLQYSFSCVTCLFGVRNEPHVSLVSLLSLVYRLSFLNFLSYFKITLEWCSKCPSVPLLFLAVLSVSCVPSRPLVYLGIAYSPLISL